jgi:predicted O-methyltransferase YrrM
MRAPVFRAELGWRRRAFFGAFGLRPPAAEHTEVEGALLRKYAADRKYPVEIGVAEGGGGWELRRVMDPDGILRLIDPYYQSNFGRLSPTRLIAHRLIGSVDRGSVEWIEKFSHDAIHGWRHPIDFLFMDGDHSPEAVTRDWDDWSPHLTADAIVGIHDANPDAPWVDEHDGPPALVRRITETTDWRKLDTADSLVILGR